MPSSRSEPNLESISSHNPRTFFLITEVFRRAAGRLEIDDPSSEEGCRLAMIVSGMRCGLDSADKLAENATNIYRADCKRRSMRRMTAWPYAAE